MSSRVIYQLDCAGDKQKKEEIRKTIKDLVHDIDLDMSISDGLLFILRDYRKLKFK